MKDCVRRWNIIQLLAHFLAFLEFLGQVPEVRSALHKVKVI